MEKKVRVNTLKVTFKRGSKEPTDAEMFQFCREQGFQPEDVYSVHKDKDLGAILIKFKTEALMRAAIEAMQPVMEFHYGDGTNAEVVISEADNSFKYVRIFNLPPEIEDKEIHQALSQYGTIRQQVREKYHQDTGFPVFSTVRGLYMEISKEIPPQIRIRHFQARIYYDGLVNKCFICRSPDHVKQNCPKKAATVTKTSVQSRLYSDIAAAKSLLPPFLNRSTSEKEVCKMTTLNKPLGNPKSPSDKPEDRSEEKMDDTLEQPEGELSKQTKPAPKEAEGDSSKQTKPAAKEAEDPEGKWEKQTRKGRPKRRSDSEGSAESVEKRLLSAQSRRSRSRSQQRKGGSSPKSDDQIFKKPPTPSPRPSPLKK